MNRLQLSVLGAPSVAAGGRPLSFPTRKALALLIYLAVEGHAHTRAHLAALLWPESDTAHARLSLRRALGQLRDALGERAGSQAHLRIADDQVAFVSAGAELDLDALREHTLAQAVDRRAALEVALASYRGDFLEGFALPDAAEYDAWAAVQREFWHRRLALVLDQLSGLALAEGEAGLAVATARRWVGHDPLDEAAHRRLIEAHAATGARMLAHQAYASLKALLARELAVPPSPETDALLAELGHMPLQAARPGGPAAEGSQLLDLPLAGRAAELRRLAGVYHALSGSGTHVAVIAGEAGIGKTRLAAEFTAWAISAGADLLHGRAFEAGGRVPYQPVVDALRPRLDRENAPDDLLDDTWLAELALLLPELRQRYPDLAPPSADPSTARVRLFESVVALCAALCARRPTIWFVDDAHWADAASLDLLRYCVRRLTEQRVPLLVLCTLRSEDLVSNGALTAWLNGLQRDGTLVQLELAPLSAGDAEWLLATLTTATWPAGAYNAFARWLYAETEGQPLYLIETLKALIDGGLVQVERGLDGHTSLSLHGDLASIRGLVPPTVRAVLRGRLAQLDSAGQALMTAAAVLGRAASFEQLCVVAGLAEREGLAALDEALARRLMLERPGSLAGQAAPAGYTCAHDKIRDVVYTEAGDARRRIFHRRAFDALADAPASERGHHALAGGLVEQACLYSIAAGDEAVRVFAIEDAIGLYEQARSLLDLQAPELGVGRAAAQAPHLYLQLGRMYELHNALDQASATYRELLTAARARAWQAPECAALNRLATVLVQQHVDLAAALPLLHEAHALARRIGGAAELAETEWNLAQLHFYDAQPEQAHAHGSAALDLARRHGLAELAARSLNVLAFAASALARCGEAAHYAEQASAAFETLDNRAMQADSLAHAGNALINQGRIAQGLEYARRSYAACRAIGNAWGMVASSMTLAGGLCDGGDYGGALHAAAEAVRLAREHQATMLQILALGVLGMVQRYALQLETARATHQEAWDLAAPSGARLLVDMAAAELCADCVLAGEMQAAAGYAREALAVRDYIFTLFMGRVQAFQVAALVWSGETELARRDLERFDRRIGEQPRYRVGSLHGHAILARQAGDLRQALAGLVQASTIADRLGLPGEQWLLLYELAGTQRACGQAGRAAEQRARAETIVHRLASRLPSPMRAPFVESAEALGARLGA
jgi:DNA-binding SARP family transcriptional activator/tetratricopeptide (TPR) repeat protein